MAPAMRRTSGSPELVSWRRWLGTAQGYMRLAREGNTQALADLGIEQALRKLATPRDLADSDDEPEGVDAELKPTGPLDQHATPAAWARPRRR